MKRFSLLASLLILSLALLGSGCDLFGGSSDPVAVATVTNVPLKFTLKGGTVTPIAAAPSRQVNNPTQAVKFEYYDAVSGAQITPTAQTVAAVGADEVVTVTGPFLGVTLFVKVISTADTTKYDTVIMGKLPTSVASTTTPIENLPEISPATIVATRIFLQEKAATGATLEEKIKSVAAQVTFSATAATADTTPNTIKLKAEIVVQQITDGVIAVADVNTLLNNLDGSVVAPTVTINTVTTNVTTAETASMTVSGVTPASIAVKDIATTDIVIAGTNFGADAGKLAVKIGGQTATIKTATDTALTVNLTANQAETLLGAQLYGGTASTSTLTIDKTVTFGATNSKVSVTTTDVKLTITAAALQNIATTPASTLQIVKSSTQAITVTATYDYGTPQTVTANATYAATGGSFTANNYTAPATTGTDTITVSFGGKTATIAVTIIDSPLAEVFISTETDVAKAVKTAVAATVKQGFTQQMYLYGIHEDTVTRANSFTDATLTFNPVGAATIDASTGIMTIAATTTGTFTIVAVKGGFTSPTYTITVDALQSVQLTAAKGGAAFASGGTMKMTDTLVLSATGTYAAAGAGVALANATFTATGGTVAGAVFTPTAPGAATVKATFAGTDSTTINITVDEDPGIDNDANATVLNPTPATVTSTTMTKDENVNAAWNEDGSITVTWTTAYAIKGGKITFSTPSQFGGGLDITLKTVSESATTAATRHSEIISKTSVNVLTGQAVGTIATTSDWVFQVSYDNASSPTLSKKFESDQILLKAK